MNVEWQLVRKRIDHTDGNPNLHPNYQPAVYQARIGHFALYAVEPGPGTDACWEAKPIIDPDRHLTPDLNGNPRYLTSTRGMVSGFTETLEEAKERAVWIAEALSK